MRESLPATPGVAFAMLPEVMCCSMLNREAPYSPHLSGFQHPSLLVLMLVL